MIYEQDTFFHLTGLGQLGLVFVSLVLAGVTFSLALKLMRGGSLWVRVGVALVVYVAFVWLSPQVYYQYFRILIEGLPSQIVLDPYPDIEAALRRLVFLDTPTISHHAQGFLGWGLIALAVGGRRRETSP
ncbi:hypothetical protein [Pseudaestuariivita atlantica]|uniref:Uncharacterized protein n=1 Tax=Pseudaestuariivita atlantica TaxID=1317121 RepID=A0A0L1JQT9_9RHOB|nr:hypothetical protein [Pseudaestuariivita atlantica]KNG94154.1 hypothetical protein ATO11_07945 [Pseudaestuariivita atlantica]